MVNGLPSTRAGSTPTIRELLATGDRSFSFEFFPPKTEEGVTSLFRTVTELRPLNPGYVS